MSTESIHVYVVQKRYQTPVPMQTSDLTAFIKAMERLAKEHFASEYPVVSAPEGSSSFWFEFEVES